MKQSFIFIIDKNTKARSMTLFVLVLLITLTAGMFTACTTQEQPGNQNGAAENEASLTIKTDSGSYVGQVDSNSIEIRISGVQDDNAAFRVFKIADEVRGIFENLSLEEDDAVRFSYYEQETGQPVLTEIEKL